MKRLKRLQKDQSTMDNASRKHQVAQDELQLQADLLETKRQLSIKEQELEALKDADKLSPADVIKCQDDIKALEAGVQALVDMQKELF